MKINLLSLLFFGVSLSSQALANMPISRGINQVIEEKSHCYPLHVMKEQILKQIKDNIIYNLPVKKEVKIAIIDTGIDYSIPAFKGKIFVPDAFKKNRLAYGLDLTTMTNEPNDTNGHGTNVAGIIISLFPSAKIFPIKYYDKNSSASKNSDNFVKALEIAVNAGVDIINISGGGADSFAKEREILHRAKMKNILVVSAAGNEKYEISPKYTATHYYPANYGFDNNIVVMGMDEDGKTKLGASNWGSIVDIAAVGKIMSYGSSARCTREMSGTSQATPVITALAAMLKSFKPELTPQEIKKIIVEQAELIPQKSGKIIQTILVHGKTESVEMTLPTMIKKVSYQNTIQHVLFNAKNALTSKP